MPEWRWGTLVSWNGGQHQAVKAGGSILDGTFKSVCSLHKCGRRPTEFSPKFKKYSTPTLGSSILFIDLAVLSVSSMSQNHALILDLTREQLFNSTPGYTWPEAIEKIYPKDGTQNWTIKIPDRTGYYSTGTYNYTKYCDDYYLFSGYSLYDCAAVAVAAILVQDQDYILLDNDNAQNASLGIKSLQTFDGVGILKRILNCTRASCQGPDSEHGRQLENQYGPCGIEDITELSYDGGNPTSFLVSLAPLCSQITREPEPDIAGPGVSTWTFAYEVVFSNRLSDHNGIHFADCLGELVHSFLNPDTPRPQFFIGWESSTSPAPPQEKISKTSQPT